MSTRTHHHPAHQALNPEQTDLNDVDDEKRTNSSVILLSILAPAAPSNDTTISKHIDITLTSPIPFDECGGNDKNGADTNDSAYQCSKMSTKLVHTGSSEEDRSDKEINDELIMVADTHDVISSYLVKPQDSVDSSDIPSNDTTPEKPNTPNTPFSSILTTSLPLKCTINEPDGSLSPPTASSSPSPLPTTTLHTFNSFMEAKPSPLIDYKSDNVHITTNNSTFSTYHYKSPHTILPCQQHSNKLNDINRGILAKDLSLLVNSVPISSYKSKLQSKTISSQLRDTFAVQSMVHQNVRANDIKNNYASLHICIQKNKSQDHLQHSNDFLSLSLSPPLSRRRDMPALRGPFVSL